jgi:hypothetical protein
MSGTTKLSPVADFTPTIFLATSMRIQPPRMPPTRRLASQEQLPVVDILHKERWVFKPIEGFAADGRTQHAAEQNGNPLLKGQTYLSS